MAATVCETGIEGEEVPVFQNSWQIRRYRLHEKDGSINSTLGTDLQRNCDYFDPVIH